MKKKLILDVDTGVDDALGIMVALADPNTEILGITCCHGNTMLENVLKNTLRVLKECNRLDVTRGNTTVCGEFNFVADPEAAYIVLDRYTCPTYIAPWEFTCRMSLPWSFFDQWLAQDTTKAAFMKKISALSFKRAQSKDYQKEIIAGKGFNSCDTYAMAAAIDDTLITESEEVAVSVELEGTYTRGMMVLDYMGLLKKKHKAFIMKKIDSEKFKQMLMNSLKMKKKLILDVDTGVDDAMAIMMAVADPSVEILGITCCHGNTILENVLKNTLRVLKECNRLD
eukprot:superscaffoldBa00003130_g16194